MWEPRLLCALGKVIENVSLHKLNVHLSCAAMISARDEFVDWVKRSNMQMYVRDIKSS